jgi:hypothetical protein
MARILINNEATTVENGLNTWGKLLDWADRASAGRGLLVTAARLDGVDEPSFREAAFAITPLNKVATIEFDAIEPAALVAASVNEARDGLAGLRKHTLEVARRFRGTRVANANQGLAELTQGLGTLVALIDTLGGALGIRIEALAANGRPIVALIDDLGQPLVAVGEAQAQEDWVTVADILEFDLEPALGHCEPLFDALTAVTTPQPQPSH